MRKLKSVALTIVGIVLAVSLVACGGSGKKPEAAAKDKVIKWKMGSIYNDPKARPTFNGFGISMQKFTELVKEKSGGRIEITPYYNSVLGASGELFEQLRRGELDVFYGQPMATVDPRFGAFSVPYLFADYDEVAKLMGGPDAPLFKLAQKWVGENKGYLVSSGASVFRGFFNTKHKVVKVTDLRDMKVRIYEDPIVSLFWKRVCNASTIAYAEVYTALQTKAVDGLEFADTSVLSSKYYELGKYFTDINWQWTWAANIIIAQKNWDSLPDDLKKIVSDCAWEAMAVQKAEELDSKAKAEAELKAKGVEVYHLTPQERQVWIDYARSLDGKMRDTIGAASFDAVADAIKAAKK